MGVKMENLFKMGVKMENFCQQVLLHDKSKIINKNSRRSSVKGSLSCFFSGNWKWMKGGGAWHGTGSVWGGHQSAYPMAKYPMVHHPPPQPPPHPIPAAPHPPHSHPQGLFEEGIPGQGRDAAKQQPGTEYSTGVKKNLFQRIFSCDSQ